MTDGALKKLDWRGCRSKHRYPTEGEARAVMASIRRGRATWTRCYECSFCGGWHITKTQERRSAG